MQRSILQKIRKLQEHSPRATRMTPMSDLGDLDNSDSDPPEPHWPAIIAVLVVGLLYLALPSYLAAGPRWLAPILVVVLIVPVVITHYRGHRSLYQILGHLLSGVLTLFMIWSLVLLVLAVPDRKEPPVELLRSALALWVANVLVFALWYWRLDGGGPIGRDERHGYETGAFLFPQMTHDGLDAWEAPQAGRLWSPQFVDYLFLAFNTSTAFSPTDSPVLSRWAKVLTMVQASISLTVVALLMARAVNIL
jgi:hypothetical protein